MLEVGLDEAVGRTGYLAGLHAAQALTFDRMNRTFKRHSTVQREFGRMVRGEPRVDAELRAFLRRTYNLKAIADYETGPGSHVSADSARAAVQTARRFLECVTSLIPPTNGPAPPRAPDTPDTPAP
jgi:uncharacterized protein (UPF0332 family)